MQTGSLPKRYLRVCKRRRRQPRKKSFTHYGHRNACIDRESDTPCSAILARTLCITVLYFLETDTVPAGDQGNLQERGNEAKWTTSWGDIQCGKSAISRGTEESTESKSEESLGGLRARTSTRLRQQNSGSRNVGGPRTLDSECGLPPWRIQRIHRTFLYLQVATLDALPDIVGNGDDSHARWFRCLH